MPKGKITTPPRPYANKPGRSARPRTAKKRSFDMVLTAVKTELQQDYELYEEALLAVIRVKTWGGDATPWYDQMDDLVKGKPFAEMTHEGIKFLIEEMVRDFAKEGLRAPRTSQ